MFCPQAPHNTSPSSLSLTPLPLFSTLHTTALKARLIRNESVAHVGRQLYCECGINRSRRLLCMHQPRFVFEFSQLSQIFLFFFFVFSAKAVNYLYFTFNAQLRRAPSSLLRHTHPHSQLSIHIHIHFHIHMLAISEALRFESL